MTETAVGSGVLNRPARFVAIGLFLMAFFTALWASWSFYGLSAFLGVALIVIFGAFAVIFVINGVQLFRSAAQLPLPAGAESQRPPSRGDSRASRDSRPTFVGTAPAMRQHRLTPVPKAGKPCVARPLETWRTDEGFAAFVRSFRAGALEKAQRLEGWVPCTTWWWLGNDGYLGRIALRHRLTERLLREGGHIGYDVRPAARRRGHDRDAARRAS